MAENFVAQGLELMLYGMGTVVLFLALLVLVTTVMSGVIGRYFPEPTTAAPARPARPSAPAAAGTPDSEVVAAITAALRQHRNRKH